MSKNKKLIKNLCELYMKKLYNEKVIVFFRNIGHWRAIFRSKDLPPCDMRDWNKWENDKISSITFHHNLFNNNFVVPDFKKVILHEVTHFKILTHSPAFYNELKKNQNILKKLKIWRKYKEAKNGE